MNARSFRLVGAHESGSSQLADPEAAPVLE